MKTLTYSMWILSGSLGTWLVLWAVTGHWLTAAVGMGMVYAALRLLNRLLISPLWRWFLRVTGLSDRQCSPYPNNWDQIRKQVYRRDGHSCQNCGATDVPIEAHHIVPIRLGGTNHLSNLISLCSDCHGKADRRLR